MSISSRMIRAAAAVPLFLLSLTGCSQLGAFNAVIPKDEASVAARGLSYGPDPRHRLDIYAPPAGVARAGTIVFFYGGSWNSGSRGEYGFAGRALASRGFTTVVFDYRLVPDHRYPVFVEDSAAAVVWTYRNIAAHGGDPQRLFLVGHSAGAYNAMMVALAPEFLAAEGLSPDIVRGAAGLSGPYDFLPLAVDATKEAFRDAPDLPATQPVNRVGRAAPPLLLLHGAADDLVGEKNLRNLASAMRAAGRPVEEKLYPGVDHAGTLLALSRPLRGRAPVLDDVVRFLGAIR